MTFKPVDFNEVYATIPQEEFERIKENLWKVTAYDNMMRGLEHFNIKISFETDRNGNYINYWIKTQSDDWGIHWER